MNKERVLVTGGLGFIGSHIVDLLCVKDYEVGVADIKPYSEYDFKNPLAYYFRLDICDYEVVRRLFSVFEPSYVFHCAALARIQPSFENPEEYFRSNALGTYNILKISRKYNVKRVVYSASSSAYGDVQQMPLCEDMALTPTALHPYGSTKRMGEMLMSDMGRMTGGPETVSLRYFNVYGPRQPTEGDYATVIGIFLRQMKNREPLTIVPDGYQRRDFTHVSDVARANLLAMTSYKVGDAEIINIGTGISYSVWDVARLILLKIPLDSDETWLLNSGLCRIFPPRKGEVRETLADISKAKKLLGWTPSISLKKGIAMTRKYFFAKK
ncbi:MAG: NAD-dependent dehydratase [Candidatus Tagabacteria bacterium CG09_land_8_20_14_0_10_41_14]|uniref:NAD-dependent dehydratase n=2 Tax=Candidatus Tagaibacteriota TaxID=1817918 RepID=A0A2H0WNB2_9BACT|nr:MAG: NAD-dependent dehydratase [Candidatus Tagabacteria bacterium CG09_land_8_20_14_0_10_41_14]PJE73093.1 MAG: NAD-dependent dehydratase [Candidatus Tagabacteria bacterium CG10_big_fil_rev_8_21_14_0_10_40_13]